MLQLTTTAKDVIIDPLDWPRCAVCHLPVEDFHAFDTGFSLSFLAHCHGAEEITEVPDELWDNIIGTHFTLGTAFGEDDNE